MADFLLGLVVAPRDFLSQANLQYKIKECMVPNVYENFHEF